MNFLPKDYKEPEGNYFKIQPGKNTFRILSSAVVGYEYWNKDSKPVRSREPFQGTPADIKLDEKTGKPTTVKHFWAFVVYNYRTGTVQIMQIAQKGLQQDIRALTDDEAWGDPKTYDITITKTGTGFDTDYSVMPVPKSEGPGKIDISYINLEALYDGDDPFGGTDEEEGSDDDGFAKVPAKKKK